jgi:hypothetical protein
MTQARGGFRSKSPLIGFIDPPSRFASAEQWREFLARLQGLPQDDPQVRAVMGRKVLELRRRGGDLQ